MLPQERIINTMEGRSVDRLPIMDIFHNAALMERITGKAITKQNAEDVACEAVRSTLDLCRHFTIPDPEQFAETEFMDEDGFVIRSSWWTGAYLSCPCKSAPEAAEMMKRDIERIRKAIEEHRVISLAQVNLNLIGEHAAYFEEVEEIFNRIAEKIYPAVSICPETEVGMCTALARYGYENFFYTLEDDPDVALEYYDALTDYEIEKIRTYGKNLKSPVAMLSEALATNTGLLFGYEFSKRVQFPNIQRQIDAWREAGKKVIMHADGNKWDLCDDLIAMGADALNPCETLADMRISDFCVKYPDTTIGSNIDCSQLLANGSVQEVRAACEQAVCDAWGKRVFLGSSSEIHPHIPLENALVMYDVFQNYAP